MNSLANNTGYLCGIHRTWLKMYFDIGRLHTPAGADNLLYSSRLPQTVEARQHGAFYYITGARRRRPLRRRRCKTLVDRERKPWTRERRRLLG
jgi:hypothetical protein